MSCANPVQLAFRTSSPEATQALGCCLGELLFDGVVLGLEGEMGSGKTTLVRGLAEGLEIEGAVTSPTFALMQEHAGRLTLWHMDAWMAAREDAFLEAGGADLLGGEGVAVVEWAENVAQWLPKPRLRLNLEFVDIPHLGSGATSGAMPPPARLLRISLIQGSGAESVLGGRLGHLLNRLQEGLEGLEGIEKVVPVPGPPPDAHKSS